MLGGRARQYTDAAEATLSAGHALVIRPGAFHDYHDCGDLDLINGAVLPSLFARELGWIYEDARIGRLLQPPAAHPTNPWTIPLSPEAFSRCRGMLEPVVAGRGKPAPAGKAGMVGLLLRLLEELGVAAEAHYGAAAAVTPVVRRAEIGRAHV